MFTWRRAKGGGVRARDIPHRGESEEMEFLYTPDKYYLETDLRANEQTSAVCPIREAEFARRLRNVSAPRRLPRRIDARPNRTRPASPPAPGP